MKRTGNSLPGRLAGQFKELFIVEKKKDPSEKSSPKKVLKDFWFGKPHEERRLGDLYVGDTGLYKHREWRGVVDTMYYFNMIWLYNYIHMVSDLAKYGGGPVKGTVNFMKGVTRYRWMGQTYLTVMHWFDRGLEGMRGPILRGSAWHYRAMVSETIRQFQEMFASDKKLHSRKESEQWKHNIAHNETVSGSIFYGFHDILEDIPLEMIPYFV